MEKKYYGQALLNGIIIKGEQNQTTAIIKPSGKIIIKKQKRKIFNNGNIVLNTPLIRGIFVLISYLISFIKSLNDSAEFIKDELDEFDNNKKVSNKLNLYLIDILILIAILFSITFSFLSLIIIPSIIVYLLDMIIQIKALDYLLEGFLRILIFYLILKLSGKIKKINNMYMYHGAFHKIEKCYYDNKELTLENIKQYSCHSNQCGINLIFNTMIASVIIFSTIQIFEPNLLNTFSRVIYMIMFAGIFYEIQLLNIKNLILFNMGKIFQNTLVKEPTNEIILLVKKTFETNLENNQKEKENE